MKCQSCDIHTAIYKVKIPLYIDQVHPDFGTVKMLEIVEKEICSECADEMEEKIKVMF